MLCHDLQPCETLGFLQQNTWSENTFPYTFKTPHNFTALHICALSSPPENPARPRASALWGMSPLGKSLIPHLLPWGIKPHASLSPDSAGVSCPEGQVCQKSALKCSPCKARSRTTTGEAAHTSVSSHEQRLPSSSQKCSLELINIT